MLQHILYVFSNCLSFFLLTKHYQKSENEIHYNIDNNNAKVNLNKRSQMPILMLKVQVTVFQKSEVSVS